MTEAKKHEIAMLVGEMEQKRLAFESQSVMNTLADPVEREKEDTLVVPADEFERIRQCLSNPQEKPSAAAIRGAEILSRLPTPHDYSRTPRAVPQGVTMPFPGHYPLSAANRMAYCALCGKRDPTVSYWKSNSKPTCAGCREPKGVA